MRKEEKKMRKLLKDAWTDWHEVWYDGASSEYFCSVYMRYVEVAEKIFPQINIERSEALWNREWKRNND